MKKNKSYLYYVIGTYVLFLVMLLLTKVVMDVFQNDIMSAIAKNICSWAPTIIVIIFLPKLMPGKKRKEFFKSLFKKPLDIKKILSLVILQIIIFGLSIELFSIISNKSISSFMSFTLPTLLLAFVNSLTSGATGEESGWRGYLQPVMEERHGLIKGSIIVGLIWGFWHAPLWLASGDYVGLELIEYICLFLTFVVSISVIIGINYKENNNILLPVIMHFIVNFTMAFINSNLLGVLLYMAIIYLIVAICYYRYYTNKKNNN